jgi:hypothetical protein
MKYLALAIIMALSTGCASEARKQEKMQERIAEAQEWCGQMGINYFNSAFQQCYMTRYESELVRSNESKRRMGMALSKGFNDYAASMERRRQQYPVTGRPN